MHARGVRWQATAPSQARGGAFLTEDDPRCAGFAFGSTRVYTSRLSTLTQSGLRPPGAR